MNDCHVTLKLPQAFEGLKIEIWNRTGRPLNLQQDKAIFVDGKWVVNIYLHEPDYRLKLVPGA